MLFGTQKINQKGHLEIGDVDTVDLIYRFGTPVVLLDGALVEENARAYVEALNRLKQPGRIYYASKANCTVGLLKKMKRLGLGVDVASLGELATAIKASFPPSKIIHHGNNKSEKELKCSLQYGVGFIVVDNEDEVERLLKLSRFNRGSRLMFRIAPAIAPQTHKYISTGQLDSKFGFLLQEEKLSASMRRLAEHYSVCGLHCHIGSQILSTSPYLKAAEVMVSWMQRLSQATGLKLSALNLGGGLGIRYRETDSPVSIHRFVKDSVRAVRRACHKLSFPVPQIFFEPGRSIIGEAGTTLYRIGSIKKIPGVRTYLAVDGGMADNPRVALYGASFPMLLANRAKEKRKQKYSVAGKCCESGDMLGWDVWLPEAKTGDLLAICCTGAYTYSMASNYNRLGKPAQVWVKNGKTKVISKAQTVENLLSLDA